MTRMPSFSHDANIPDALHFIEDIRTLELSPISTIVERIRQLYPDAMIMLHASLECTNFSKAKGRSAEMPTAERWQNISSVILML